MTPQPTYVARSGSPLAADPAVYGPIARETDARTILHSEVIPVRSGRASFGLRRADNPLGAGGRQQEQR